MPKKKKEIQTPETSEEQAKEPEDQEIGQSDDLKGNDDSADFASDQLEAMSDILDDEGQDLDELAQKPAEEKQEQESQPEKAEEESKQEKVETHGKEDEPEQAAKEEKPEEEKSKEVAKSEKTTPEDKSLDVTYEVIEPDGVKQVPVKNLITTYQQFGNLQRRHTAIKPLFDLMEKSQVPVDMIYPYLEVGIAYMQQVQNAGDGRQVQMPGMKFAMPQPEVPEQKPGQYQGPFGSEDKDEYYKEVDPDLHAAMWTMFNMIAKGQPSGMQQPNDLMSRITALEQVNQQNVERNSQEKMKEGLREIDNRITNWAGDHNDYFTDQTRGKNRLEGFRNFIIGRYPESKIKDLTPEFLSAVFAAFDPVYYNEYLKKLAASKQPEEKSGTFSESSGVRQPTMKLTEQEQYMADLL